MFGVGERTSVPSSRLIHLHMRFNTFLLPLESPSGNGNREDDDWEAAAGRDLEWEYGIKVQTAIG